MRSLAIAALSLLLAATAARTSVAAGSGILDLGSPTNDVPNYVPLSGFHRISQSVASPFRAEVLFIGTQSDVFSAMERWPVVKALEQFGTLRGVKALTPPCPTEQTSGPCLFAYPTYNWSKASYTSRYVAFVHRDVANVQGRPFQHLTSQETALVHRYGPAQKPGQKVNLDPCSPATMRSYPIVLIGRYLETLSNVVNCGDYTTQQSLPSGGLQHVPLSFEEIRSRIAGDVRPTGPDINTEVNVISALICRADHLQPKTVCGRAVIKTLLKHVK